MDCLPIYKRQIIENIKKSQAISISIGSSKEIALLGRYYALKREANTINSTIKTVKKTIAWAIKNYKHCCIITEERHVPYIQSVLSLFDNYSVGIIAGRNYWETLYIINKNLVSGRMHKNVLCIDRTDYTTKQSLRIDGYTYIPYSDSSKEEFIRAMGESLDVLSFMGHGRDELLWLKGGAICSGLLDMVNTKNEDICETLPSCRFTGKCQHNNTQILPIREIFALNVFVNACFSGKVGSGWYGSQHNVPQVFLGEYSATYIGTPFVAKPIEALTHYYTALVMAGAKMGSVCRYINNFCQNYHLDYKSSHFLFGDPYYSFAVNLPIAKHRIVSCEGASEIILLQKTPLLVLLVSGNLFDDFFNFKKEVVLVNNSNQPIYCNMTYKRTSKSTVLHVFTRGLLEKGKYVLRITKSDVVSKQIISGMYSMSALVNMGIADSAIKKYLDESMGALENFTVLLNSNMTRLDNIGKVVYSKYNKLKSRFEHLHETVVRYMHNKIQTSGTHLEDVIFEKGFEERARTRIKKNCPYCNGSLQKSEFFSDIYNISRYHLFCQKCGNIFSSPAKSKLVLQLICEEMISKSKVNNMTLCVENTGDIPYSGVACVAIEKGVRDDIITSPELLHFNCKPREKIYMEFKISCNMSSSRKMQLLIGVIMSNNQFYSVQRPIYCLNE